MALSHLLAKESTSAPELRNWLYEFFRRGAAIVMMLRRKCRFCPTVDVDDSRKPLRLGQFQDFGAQQAIELSWDRRKARSD